MAVTIWDGSTDGDFATGANWDTAAKPVAGDEIIFDCNYRGFGYVSYYVCKCGGW